MLHYLYDHPEVVIWVISPTVCLVGGLVTWWWRKNVSPALKMLKNASQVQKLMLNAAKLEKGIEWLQTQLKPDSGSSFFDQMFKKMDGIEQTLHLQNEVYRTRDDSLRLRTFEANPNGQITWVSQRLSDDLGLDKESMLGSGWLNGIDEQSRETAERSWTACIKGQRDIDIRVFLIAGVKVRIIAKALRNSKGEVAKYAGELLLNVNNETVIDPNC